MTDLNKRLANLSPEKRALLIQQLSRQLPAKNNSEITVRERPIRIPLSFAQQRLWILDQLEPESSTYNVPHALWMLGKPNKETLERVLSEIVSRHEVLRTVILADEQGPFQSVNPAKPFAIDTYDFRHLAKVEQEPSALKLALDEAARPFDISKGPLLRSSLVILSDNKHLFFMNAHHIAVDGWSYSVIFNELCQLYQAYVDQQDSPLAELSIQYIDYTLWQRELLAEGSDTLNKQLAFWQDKLGGSLPVLELPSDRARPPIQTNFGAVYCHKVSKDIYAQLKTFSQQKGVTPFMTFATIFQILLSRYSGQLDIILGVGIANRRRQELEALVGFFVNTLALRFDLSGDPSFQELLGKVKEVMLEADSNQDLPIERLIEVLDVERSMSHSPLFQAMLFFQNFPIQEIQLPEVTLVPVEPGTINAGVARNDISLFAGEEDGGLSLYFEYATELFDQQTIEAMANNLVHLLESALKDPDEKISKLEIMSEKESSKLLNEWNATSAEFDSAICIHHLFESQVALSPDAIAVNHLDESLTYQELNQRANVLAHQLVHAGVKEGELVGLFTSRSPSMLVGLLAILKSGAAYVPLDPTYPADRIDYMISDANISRVICDKAQQSFLLASKLQMLVIENNGLDITINADLSNKPPVVSIGPSSAAYVIYTSGTTGRPKGVVIHHGAVVNFLKSMAIQPGMTDKDIVCAVTTLSFDIAVLELLLPLTVGAKIEIADSTVVADGNKLATLLADAQATFMQATPTSWRMLLDSGWSSNKKIKILSGGEPLTLELANELLSLGNEVWNMYGPTETTIWSSIQQIRKEQTHINVGKPIANTQVYILDNNGELVPIGVSGELHIGGSGVACGYLGRDELTSEKFVSNPFDHIANSKLYRTGDLARWTRDGEIEILGRIDQQVKLRGYRIELGEIESVICEHRLVSQSAVLCREDRPGDKRLVAYILLTHADENASEIINELRKLTKQRLAEYMLPSAFVVLEKLPLTPNGKIDRASFPKPELDAIETEKFAIPRNEEEQKLLMLWSEILDLQNIGIHDDFFKLGGHSLLATQLISKIQRTFNCDVSLRSLFNAPTVAAMAELLMNERINNIDPLDLAGMLDQLEHLSSEALESLLENEEA